MNACTSVPSPPLHPIAAGSERRLLARLDSSDEMWLELVFTHTPTGGPGLEIVRGRRDRPLAYMQIPQRQHGALMKALEDVREIGREKHVAKPLRRVAGVPRGRCAP